MREGVDDLVAFVVLLGVYVPVLLLRDGVEYIPVFLLDVDEPLLFTAPLRELCTGDELL